MSNQKESEIVKDRERDRKKDRKKRRQEKKKEGKKRETRNRHGCHQCHRRNSEMKERERKIESES